MNSLTSILKRFKSKPMGPVPTPDDWAVFESVVGRTVPEDFKKIIEYTGGANMGCCYLRNPEEQHNISLALTGAALKHEHIIWNDIVSKMMGVTWFPEPGGLIQIAHVDSISFMLSYRDDNIMICDRDSWETIDTKLIFSDLIWSIFTNRKQYDELGIAIWRSSRELFGWQKSDNP